MPVLACSTSVAAGEAVVLDVGHVNGVSGFAGQRTEFVALVVVHGEGVGDVDRTLVEQDVVGRTQAQHVVDGVGSVVGLAECPDVGSFGVVPDGEVQDAVTYLAGVLVKGFHPVRDSGVSYDSHGDTNATTWVR